MNRFIGRAGRAVASTFGLRVVRAGLPNRFQAMAETLRWLRTTGYAPRVVIDAGANEGQWYGIARSVFDDVRFHLIEPQPACAARLRESTAATVHPLAVTAPGVLTVRMIGSVPGNTSGAFIALSTESGDGELVVSSATLDELFADSVTTADRALLKLDLEGHELPALVGAVRLLAAVEVVIVEVRFFQFRGDDRPAVGDVLTYLRDCGFELFDIAALSSRHRDKRLKMGDLVFVRRDSPLMADSSWE